MKNEEYWKLNVGDEVICRISTNITHANFVYKLKGFYGTKVRITLPYHEVEYNVTKCDIQYLLPTGTTFDFS